jgi:hypothetical protein
MAKPQRSAARSSHPSDLSAWLAALSGGTNFNQSKQQVRAAALECGLDANEAVRAWQRARRPLLEALRPGCSWEEKLGRVCSFLLTHRAVEWTVADLEKQCDKRLLTVGKRDLTALLKQLHDVKKVSKKHTSKGHAVYSAATAAGAESAAIAQVRATI